MNSTQLDQQEEAIRYLAERVSLLQCEVIGTPELEVLDRVVFLLDYNKQKDWEKEFDLLWGETPEEELREKIKSFIKNLIK